jgi:hypothetical protein
MSRFQEVFDEMLLEHEKEFSAFKKVHDLYKLDQQKWTKQFNELGIPVLDIVREYENRLCSGMEQGGKGEFTSLLSEKFWQLVREYLPLIDLVGAKLLE